MPHIPKPLSPALYCPFPIALVLFQYTVQLTMYSVYPCLSLLRKRELRVGRDLCSLTDSSWVARSAWPFVGTRDMFPVMSCCELEAGRGRPGKELGRKAWTSDILCRKQQGWMGLTQQLSGRRVQERW